MTCPLDLQQCQQNLGTWKYALNNTAIVSETDACGRITEVNDKFLEISGYSREELIGTTHQIVSSKFHSEEFFTAMWGTISQGRIWRGEVKNQRKDGSYYWVDSTITPILNQEGTPVSYIAIQFDISDRKDIEEKLARSQQRFEKLATNLPGAIYQFVLYPDGAVAFPYVSRGCRNFFEFDEGEIQDDSSLVFDRIHPEDRSSLEHSIAISAETLEPWEWEGRYIAPSGKIKWMQATSRPEKQANGDILWDGMFIEVTEQKAAQEALKKSEQKLALHFQHTPLAVIEWNLNFEVMEWNSAAEKIFGYSKSEAIGRHAAGLIVPESVRELVDRVWNDLLSQQGGTRCTNDNFTKDGRTIVCEWYNTALIDPNGNTMGVASLVQDVTERQEYQEALKVANEVLENRVEERTAQLRQAIAKLRGEITSRQLAEEAVRQAEEKYRSIFENAIMGIFQSTPNGKYVSANPALARIYGYDSPEELMAKVSNIGERLYVESNRRAEFIEAIDRYDRISEFESQVYRQDGTIIWIAENARAVKDARGTILYYEGTVEEITKRKQTEAALRRSEERLQEKALREALLNQLTEQIRQSLDLDTILETTVREVRELLQIELCFFGWYRRHPSPSWEIVKEAKEPDFHSFLGIYDDIAAWSHKCLQLQTVQVDDVSVCENASLQAAFIAFGFKSVLSLPLQTHSGKVGVLSCIHCSMARGWAESEAILLRAVIDRLAIAIAQAELYAQSRAAAEQAQEQAQQLERALHQLQETQTQLIQTEKMSSLGQMVAGVAHEINNPVTFIHGNAIHASNYFQELLPLLKLYQHHYPTPVPEIQNYIEEIDLEFLLDDLPKALASMLLGSERIRQIVLSLRNFSRLDEAQMKPVDIHEGIENTLLIVQHRLKEIQVIKEYDDLPLVECYAGQLNQVFMNVLTNAIDALESSVIENGEWGNKGQISPTHPLTPSSPHPAGAGLKPAPTPPHSSPLTPHPTPTIRIRTERVNARFVAIRIADNGPGMTEEVTKRLFDPFFTTKAVGKGTGLGLSISYSIVVEKHEGILQCVSEPGCGTEFLIQIPIQPPKNLPDPIIHTDKNQG